MLHACAPKFDVTKNLKKILVFGVNKALVLRDYETSQRKEPKFRFRVTSGIRLTAIFLSLVAVYFMSSCCCYYNMESRSMSNTLYTCQQSYATTPCHMSVPRQWVILSPYVVGLSLLAESVSHLTIFLQ